MTSTSATFAAPSTTHTVAGTTLLSVVFILLSASLGIQWVSLASFSSAGNLKHFHLLGFVFMVLFAARRQNWLAAIEVQRSLWVFSLGALVYLVVITYMSLYLIQPYFSVREAVRQWFGFGMFLAVSPFILRVFREGGSRALLVWVTILTSATTGILLLWGVARTGGNPLELVKSSIASVDSRILVYGLFRTGIVAGDDAELAANVRHGVLTSLLGAFFISYAAYGPTREQTSRLKKVLFVSAALGTVFLVTFSLSRSAMLVLFAFVFIATAEIVMQRKGPLLVVLVGPPLLAALALLAYSDFGALMQQRFFEETASYEGRLGGIEQALERIRDHPFFPAEFEQSTKSHNLMLDAWAGGGIFAVIGATTMFTTLLFLWSRQFVEFVIFNRRWQLGIPQSAVLGLGLIALIRFLTAGNGTLHPGEWIALAAFAGCYAANRRVAEGVRR